MSFNSSWWQLRRTLELMDGKHVLRIFQGPLGGAEHRRSVVAWSFSDITVAPIPTSRACQFCPSRDPASVRGEAIEMIVHGRTSKLGTASFNREIALSSDSTQTRERSPFCFEPRSSVANGAIGSSRLKLDLNAVVGGEHHWKRYPRQMEDRLRVNWT